MKQKEFNLKKSRYELARQLREDFGIHNSKAWSIVKRVEKQDKEFIRTLKEKLDIDVEWTYPQIAFWINKLSGEALLK